MSFEEIGEKIKLIRESKGLSQTTVAEELTSKGIKISRETLSKIENGNRTISIIEIKMLAEVLNVSTDDFFGEEDEQEENLVTLFRKKKKSELNEKEKNYLSDIQMMVKGLIAQEKIYDGEMKKSEL